MKALVPGKYKVKSMGYIHERLFREGETVEISQEFLDSRPDFQSTWLELVEAYPKSKARRAEKAVSGDVSVDAPATE